MARRGAKLGHEVRSLARDAAPRGVRAAAAWALERTLQSRAPGESFLRAAQAPFDERDQALLRELVYGSLRWLRRLDWVIAKASHRDFGSIETALVAPLRIAAYQILFLNRVPAHAAVDEAVDHALHLTHRGGASFVNAVLRRIARSPRLEEWPVEEDAPLRRLGIEHSHPDFLVERWVDRLGRDRAVALMQANNLPRPLHLLAFRDRGGRELLAESLIDDGLEVSASAIAPLGLIVRSGNPRQSAAFREGSCYIQDEASQAAALVPLPAAGERILDLAAAPGGKSFSLLAWEPALDVTLADASVDRIALLRQNLARLRRRHRLLAADAAAPSLSGRMDRVLLDLPCSGTGTLRKHPEIKWRLSEGEIHRLADQGLRLLEGAAPLVGAGGLLVAITCSLEEEENQEVVSRFLGGRGDFAPFSLTDRVPAPLERWIGGPGFWQLPTGGEHDGFTVQVLQRIE